MARPRGRPKQLYGPIVNVKLNAMTHVHLSAIAILRGQTLSQVIRKILNKAMKQEWAKCMDDASKLTQNPPGS